MNRLNFIAGAAFAAALAALAAPAQEAAFESPGVKDKLPAAY
jgi:hypothetical protein